MSNSDEASSEPGTITLLQRAAQGDPVAREDLALRFVRPGGYRDQMIQWVRSDLSQDAEDVVQSALLVFFNRVLPPGGVPDEVVRDRQHLRMLLARMLRQREIDLLKYRTARRRDSNREIALPANASGEEILPGPEPDPAVLVAVQDLVEYLLNHLEEPFRQTLEMLLEGRKPAEIAVSLGMREKTVYPRIEMIRARVRALLTRLAASSPDFPTP